MEILHSLRVRYAEIASDVLADKLLPGYPRTTIITVGWPSKGANRSKRLALGECAPHAVDTAKPNPKDTDKAHFISLHPRIFREPLEVLHVLAHEMIHAIYPKAGHRGEFVGMAKDLGLVRPWTATSPGPKLADRLMIINGEILTELGSDFPSGGAELMPGGKKQGIRQVKGKCGCGRIVRASRTVWEQGNIMCGICESRFVVEG